MMGKEIKLVASSCADLATAPPTELVNYVTFVKQFRKLNSGLMPTQTQVIEQVGGSFTTVGKAFKWLKDTEALAQGLEHRYGQLPEPVREQIDKEVINSLRRLSVTLWDEARELADSEARFYKRKAHELEHELEIHQIESANNIRYLEDQILRLKAEHKI